MLADEPEYRRVALTEGWQTGFRPVDCDLATLLYIAAADRLGWPLVPVELPGHVFVRWRFDDGSFVNWETTVAVSFSDDEVRDAYDAGDIVLEEMSRRAVEVLYTGTLLHSVDTPECVRAIFDRIAVAPELVPEVRNLLAWELATNEMFRGDTRLPVALDIARRNTQLWPADCALWDTLSCAQAAGGDFAGAAETERRHVSPQSPRIEAYEARRDCYDPTVAAAGGCPPPGRVPRRTAP